MEAAQEADEIRSETDPADKPKRRRGGRNRNRERKTIPADSAEGNDSPVEASSAAHTRSNRHRPLREATEINDAAVAEARHQLRQQHHSQQNRQQSRQQTKRRSKRKPHARKPPKRRLQKARTQAQPEQLELNTDVPKPVKEDGEESGQKEGSEKSGEKEDCHQESRERSHCARRKQSTSHWILLIERTGGRARRLVRAAEGPCGIDTCSMPALLTAARFPSALWEQSLPAIRVYNARSF